jgi:NtrC-family two-component system response regulator AlgB
MHVLIIDDEASIRKTTRIGLETCGHTVTEAGNAVRALRVLGEQVYDVIFLDLKLGSDDGLDLLSRIRTMNPDQVVIMFTAYASVSTAVKAIKLGAYDFIPKPFTPQAIRDVIRKVEASGKIIKKELTLNRGSEFKAIPFQLDTAEFLVEKALAIALKAAPSSANILIYGGSGIGKRSLALEIHRRSAQREESFNQVRANLLTSDYLESITSGTLYVHDLANLDLEMQGYFLHWLDGIHVKISTSLDPDSKGVRLISSSAIALEECVKQGVFREDLLYRLNVVTVNLPDIALRPADLKYHAENAVTFYCKRLARSNLCINPLVIDNFKQYTWPGNFREFNHVIESAVATATGTEIQVSDLPIDWHKNKHSLKQATQQNDLHHVEADHISRVIKESKNYDEAALKLGIANSTLYRKRQKFGL